MSTSEVRARCSASHQSAFAVGTVAEERNLGWQQLLLDIFMTETTKTAAAPRINGADVREAGTVHRATRHVDNFLSKNFSALVHDEGVNKIKSDFASSFDAFAGFAETCLAVFFAATRVEAAVLVAADAELVPSSDFDDARYPARRPSKQGLLGYFADPALSLVGGACGPKRAGAREQ